MASDQKPQVDTIAPSTNSSTADTRAMLKDHFSKYTGTRYGDGWEDLWARGDFLPWDKGSPNPALKETLTEHGDVIGTAIVEESRSEPEPESELGTERPSRQRRRKRALVPGCGRGVDVLLLKSFGYDVVGLEYSESAVRACHAFEKEYGAEFGIVDAEIGEGTARFVVGDFFREDWVEGVEKGLGFDLIYDYTVRLLSPESDRRANSKNSDDADCFV
jgi:methyl halide transferase